jgi:glyoxylate reductase
MNLRVLTTIPLPADALQRIAAVADVVAYGGLRPITPDSLLAALDGIDAVLGSNHDPCTPGVLRAATQLRIISQFGVGYDNIDVSVATECGVTVANTPGVLSDAVADLVIGLIVIMARRLAESERLVRAGRWDEAVRTVPLGSDLRRKTLSIVGFGRIGREVAARALACKMRVLAFDARSSLDVPPEVERAATLDEALARADFLTLHVDLNPTTHHLISVEQLARLAPHAYLINTSRGPVVDQDALYNVLLNKRIAGAALDVLEREPPDLADPLLQLDNVYILPHIGSATVETRRAMLDLAVDNLLALLTGAPCPCILTP